MSFLEDMHTGNSHILSGTQQNSAEEWLKYFNEIELSNINAVSKKYSIRRQTLSKKYKKWKREGKVSTANDQKGKWNKIFTDKEENEIIFELLSECINNDIRGYINDLVIREVVRKYIDATSHASKNKNFKISTGWIYDFRSRHSVIESIYSGKYYKWSVVYSSDKEKDIVDNVSME